MAVFIARRLVISFLTLLAATFLVYVLTASSGDPLIDLRSNPSPDVDNLIDARIALLELDVPAPQRYLIWLGGIAGCVLPGLECDLGVARNGQDVAPLIADAAASTLQLVIASTVIAIVVGIGAGVISALRQYSGFDYTITFSAFLFFSLPVFWIAVLLKEYGAIRINDWLLDPVWSVPVVVVISVLSGLFWMAVVGAGERRRRLIAFVAGFAATAAVLAYLSAARWFADPGLGPVGVSLSAIGLAVGVTVLVSGLSRRSVLYSALATAGVGIVSYFVLGSVLADPSWPLVIGLGLLAIVVGIVIGQLLGDLDKPQASRAGALTAFLTGSVIFADYALQNFAAYSDRLQGRPFPTVGSNTPNFEGTFWLVFMDTATHLILPTAALVLISLASYSRYSRASMLEVMNQDYVRTGRSKGLTERTVVMRHAFRNAMIPLTTLAAFDFGGLIGGAVITEAVFGWTGMGNIFIRGLREVAPDLVMGFFIITGTTIVVFNMLADITYAYLDPRIRLS